jgi:crotonobetainyl-CoA:carnitine CoA-transferase CaiB-like acyl-CoA transferase
MSNRSSLENLVVLDLTQRLPGPLATKQLSTLGAKVIKLSPIGKEDAFKKTKDPLFNEWYKNLNSSKEVIEADFNNLQGYIDKADIIIAPQSFSHQKYVLDKKALILVHGSSHGTGMHDLNALAVSDAFYLFTHKNNEKQIPPPFLPFAGIQYGTAIALNALASYIKLQEDKRTIIQDVYLDTSTKEIFNLFWNEDIRKQGETSFLHNGLFPCYNIYRTKDDSFIALACVEEHYFEKFCKIFNLSLIIEDRFDTSSRVFNILINLFSNSTLSEIMQQVGDADICLTPVE